MTTGLAREDPSVNPNSLHDYHKSRRGPRNVPRSVVMAQTAVLGAPKDPGHPHGKTSSISFEYFAQRISNAPFGYEHYVSLPPSYIASTSQYYPLILFLHGAGESQRGPGESYASIRHGIPKVILCYDKFSSDPGLLRPAIDIPLASRLRKSKQTLQGDKSGEPLSPELCTFVAEHFITVTPCLDMRQGYGWNASILSALLDEIMQRYRVDLDRVHVTGFSMGGYGTWELAMHTPNRFATLVPICGGGDAQRAVIIKHVKQWVFHGDQDDIIPLEASQQMVDALTKAGADIKFTHYPELMHDSWTAAYGDIEMYRWMYETRRVVTGDEIAVPQENKVILTACE